MRTVCFILMALASAPFACGSPIFDFRDWTVIEDPANPGMSAYLPNMSEFGAVLPPGAPRQQAVLTANAELETIPSGTDIGYASINDTTIGSSTAGYYFDPSDDFSVAIDFNVTQVDSLGGGGIGFGIGEQTTGENSAGVALAILNGAPSLFTSAARVADVNQTMSTLSSGFGRGRLFVDYFSNTGDVVVGVNATPGTSDPGVMATFSAIQDQWNEEPLLVSFYLRSQSVQPLVPALSDGVLRATFSNFEVLSGSPIAIVPEPSAIAMVSIGLLGHFCRRR